jgi:hypothetical protein
MIVYYRKMENLSYSQQSKREKANKADLIFRIITNKPKSSDIDLITKLKELYEKEGIEDNSLKEKMKIKTTPIKDLDPELFNDINTTKKITKLFHLPDEIISEIIKKIKFKYKLRDWIPLHKIANLISSNPNAIDFLSLPENKKYINYSQLSKNTNSKALELLKAEIIVNPDNPAIDWIALSRNPKAIDILNVNRNKIKLSALSGNTSPRAIQLLKTRKLELRENNSSNSSDYEDDISWYALSENTSTEAIEFLNLPENYSKINWEIFSRNTNRKAIELLTDKYYIEFSLEEKEFQKLKANQKISWRELSKNPEAISLLEIKWEEEKKLKSLYTDKNGKLKRYDMKEYKFLKSIGYIIDWTALSVNIKAIDLLRRKIEEEKKLTKIEYESLEPIEKINWWVLSANQEAIQLLEENYDNIDWVQLGKNPKAIKLLEKELQVRPQNIYWYSLSGNPKAIPILDKNRDKIVWSILSGNPKAGELLKDRVEFEKKLPKAKYNEISNYNKLQWHLLSINPSIFYI